MIGAAVLITLGKLNYHEVEEVRAGVLRNCGERRIRMANNVRVRRATHALSEAATFRELFGAVRNMLELCEFVYANARIDCRRHKAAALPATVGAGGRREGRFSDGHLLWEWDRGDIEAHDILNGGGAHFWSLRLPLTAGQEELGFINLYREINDEDLLLDINYISKLLQREVVQAIRLILDSGRAGADASTEHGVYAQARPAEGAAHVA